MYLETLQKTES